jgi:PAS domain S-box-containing protein
MNRAVLRFCWPVLLTSAAVSLRMLLSPWLGIHLPFATFYISVTLSAILGGALPGFLAIVLGILASDYFFIPPIHTLKIAGDEHAAVLAFDALVCTVLVVLATRQRRAAAEAAEGRRMLEAVMEYIPEGLTIVDAPDARPRMVSRHGAELLGMTRESLKTAQDYAAPLYHSDGKTQARMDELTAMRAIAYGEITPDTEWIVKRPDGGTSILLSRAAPIRDGRGRITGAVSAWRDITERKRLEEKLRESAKLESLGVLAGGIAHDFNNLLTSVLGHASLLMNDLPEGSSAWKSAREIVEAAEHAARLSGKMLAYSGRGRFLLERLNLSEHIRRRLAPMIESSIPRHVQLSFDLPQDLPPIEADASQLRELIMSLVCNAVEAIGPNEGRVTVATHLLSVDNPDSLALPPHEELQPGTYVALEISDTGAGMDKETVARMFEPFFTTKFPGRGLGMAVAQGIVHGHKGAILVDSAPGQGTTIRTLFPVAAPYAPDDEASLTSSRTTPPHSPS